MRVPVLLSLALVTSQASAASNSAPNDRLNGWYPCAEFTFADDSDGSKNTASLAAECAVYNAPLCYPDICTAPASVDPNVDIFVKRLPATVGDPTLQKNVWFMEGGPGASSTAMESVMIELQTRLGGEVNVYTMDHRGTGRSTLLDCVAAQAMTSGSPGGLDITVDEVPACAEALAFQFGPDLASFSITSAASDLATFISEFSNGADTFVYGVSYGTTVVERLMHLDPPEVVGYVLDGVATSSGSTLDNFEFFSTWDRDFGQVGDVFLALCAKDDECSARFQARSLPETLKDLLDKFDHEPKSRCAALVRGLNPIAIVGEDAPASYKLRCILGFLLEGTIMRTLIPALVFRLDRCSDEDVRVVTFFDSALESYLMRPREDGTFMSTLLYYLIVFSELWEIPQVDIAGMLERFTNASITNGAMYNLVPQYCAFSKENSSTCNELGVGDYEAGGIIYARDAFWNQQATIPSQASVLLMGSKLDPQTPHKYAERLFDVLDGDQKTLVTFEYATHAALWSTPLGDNSAYSGTCGMELLVSYVSNGGDLEKLDRSCVSAMPTINFSVPKDYLSYFFSTDDVYDGGFDATLSDQASDPFMGLEESTATSATSSGNSTYKIAFIVFAVLFVLALVVAAFFGFRWYKLHSEKRRRTLEMFHEQIVIPMAGDTSSPSRATAYAPQ